MLHWGRPRGSGSGEIQQGGRKGSRVAPTLDLVPKTFSPTDQAILKECDGQLGGRLRPAAIAAASKLFGAAPNVLAASNWLRNRKLAPRARFELATLRLTAECSTVELPGNRTTALFSF